MFSYVWPIVLVVESNIIYHVCTKSTPESMDAFASLIVTYSVAAVTAAILYFALNPGKSLLKELTEINWAPFVLGIVIVGLETGFLYAYRAGWQISMANVVQGAFQAVALMILGALAYHEKITVNKIIGMALCLAGLYFINK